MANYPPLDCSPVLASPSKSLASNAMAYMSTTPKRSGFLGQSGPDERITLNVGGVRHETHVSTLKNCPQTRLSKLADIHKQTHQKEEYFFDRHPAVFNSVIDFYRTVVNVATLKMNINCIREGLPKTFITVPSLLEAVKNGYSYNSNQRLNYHRTLQNIKIYYELHHAIFNRRKDTLDNVSLYKMI
ncbi:uncharacterized protein LOC115215246 isoform X1 [Octopus sinensis]|uniref:Uncharacterized protein LOC115215246 isoform X1 n=1 Tax=Octopus sinensis TaxID=2607531 RepID=A0A7E6F2H0_9MOLL|nr:uncharacterized protein LOC115215246 isoform X1 [Octopus sinensis]